MPSPGGTGAVPEPGTPGCPGASLLPRGAGGAILAGIARTRSKAVT